jgi:hypothetical protein
MLLTRDNLDKRRKVEDLSCLFCMEIESVHHLLFECVIARQPWEAVSEIIGFEVGSCYEFVDNCWLRNKRFRIINILTSAVWGGWKLRNLLCFSGCCLEKYETIVANGAAYAEVLERAVPRWMV